MIKAKAATPPPVSAPPAEEEGAGEESDFEEDWIGKTDGPVADAALAQSALDPPSSWWDSSGTGSRRVVARCRLT